MYKIIASPSFKISLNRFVDFLTIKYSPDLAKQTKHSIKNAIMDKLPGNPYFAPISSRLIDLGIKEYRQYQINEHNMVFYRVDGDCKTIILLAVMDSRQSIQKLLLDILLLS